MKTITFKNDIKLSKTNFRDISSFMKNFIENSFPNSNVENEYQTAVDMNNAGLPPEFIKNFVKSYD